MADSDSVHNESNEVTEQSFEQVVQELEAIIKRMSSGDQSLETSITEFERGVRLVRECQKILKDAEQRVEVLTNAKDGQPEIQAFEPT